MRVMELIQQITAHSADLPPSTLPPTSRTQLSLTPCCLQATAGGAAAHTSLCSGSYCQCSSYEMTKITFFFKFYISPLFIHLYYLFILCSFYSYFICSYCAAIPLCCCVNLEFPLQGISAGTIYYLNLSYLTMLRKFYHRKKKSKLKYEVLLL